MAEVIKSVAVTRFSSVRVSHTFVTVPDHNPLSQFKGLILENVSTHFKLHGIYRIVTLPAILSGLKPQTRGAACGREATMAPALGLSSLLH